MSLSRETTPWLLVSTPALNRFGELDTSTCWERWKNAESTAFTGAQRRDKKCFYVFDDRFTCTIFFFRTSYNSWHLSANRVVTEARTTCSAITQDIYGR